MGESTDGLANGFSKYAEELKALTGFDIRVEGTTDQFKDLYDIMGGIAQVWDKLTDTQQARVSEILGGTRQLQVISSILGNWKDAVGAYETAMNSAGAAARANSIYMDTAEAHINQFKAAFQTMSSSVIDTSLIKGVVDFGAGILKAISAIAQFTEAIGGLKTVLAGLIAIKGLSILQSMPTVFLGVVANVWRGISSLITAIGTGTISVKSFGAAFKGLGSSIKSGVAGLSTFSKVALGVTAALAVYSVIKGQIDKYRQSIYDAADAAVDASSQTKELYDSYSSLNEEYKRGNASLSDVISGRNELVQQLEAEGVVVDDLIAKYGDLDTALAHGLTRQKELDFEDVSKAAETAMNAANRIKLLDLSPNTGNKTMADEVYTNKEAFADAVVAYKQYQKAYADEIAKNGVGSVLAKQLNETINEYENVLADGMGRIDDANKLLSEIILDNELFKSTPQTVEEFESARDALIEAISGDKNFNPSGNLDAEMLADYAISQSNSLKTLAEEFNKQRVSAQEIEAARKDIIERFFTKDGESFIGPDGYKYSESLLGHALDGLNASQLREVAAELENGAHSLETAVNRVKNAAYFDLSKLFNGPNAGDKTISDTAYEIKGLFEQYIGDLKRAEELGVGMSDHIFGNIDTYKRAVLDLGDGWIETVDGMWDTFGDKKIPIAFSPILQTEDGAEHLSTDLVKKYINTLVEKAGDDLSEANLLRLDAQGLEIDGKKIQNMLAAIGDDAERVSEAMHFTGPDGAIAEDIKALQSFAEQYKLEWTDIVDILSRPIDFNLDITAEKASIESLSNALSESADSYGVTADSVADLTARYRDLAAFDAAKLFERTTSGIHLNREELEKLEGQYKSVIENDIEGELKGLAAEYVALSHQIEACSDSQERMDLYARRNDIYQQIQNVESLAAQYHMLTSAYNGWIQAQSQTDERSQYENVGKGYEEVQKLIKNGWTNDNEVEKYLDLMLSAGQRSGDNAADFNKLSAAIAGTTYTLRDFFKVNSDGEITTDGLANFLDAVTQKFANANDGIVTITESGEKVFDFTGDNLQKIADGLGTSTEMVEIFAKALADAGANVVFDDMFKDINDRIEKANSSIVKLKEIADESGLKTDINFSFNTTSVENVNGQIETAKQLLDEFRDDSGNIDMSIDGAAEALDIFRTLVSLKADLERKQIALFNTDLSGINDSNITAAIGKLNDYYTAYQELQKLIAEKAINPNVDTTEAQTKVDTLRQNIAENPIIVDNFQIDPSTNESLVAGIQALDPKVTLGLDSSEPDNYDPDDKDATVTFKKNATEVDNYIASLKRTSITKTVNFRANIIGNLASLFGGGGATGTAHARGTAYRSGDWGAKQTGTALVGELGPEMIVRDGKFFTVGDHSAEFAHIRRGDIIFNAEQTRQILRNGNITNGAKRGVSYAPGTGAVITISPNTKLRTGQTITSVGSKSSSSSKSSKSSSKASESVEDQLKTLKEEIDDIIAQWEFDIFMAEKHNASSEEIIAIYKKMQEAVHAQAEKYRKMGVDENNEHLRELKKQWWEYEEAIREARKKEFDEWVKDSQFAIEVMEHDEDGVDKILDSWRTILRSINDEIAYYSARGYDIASDEIQDLMKEAWDAEEQIEEILDKVLDKVNGEIDHIQDVFQTLRSAADEWGESNYLTLDTLQDIIDMGVEYMSCLREENGMLVINKEAIADMLAAKAQQLAVEGALNYVRRIGNALDKGETEELNRLLHATQQTTSATWDLVYANLAFLNLTRDQYDAAYKNLDRMRSIADNVSENILKSLEDDGESASEALEESSDALEKIIDYTKDLIKHEHEEMKDALDDQLDMYKKIVDEKKKSLDLTKSELSYNKDISNRTAEIAKLQAQADALALDDSREAQIKRAKILEEIAKKQEELEEKQRDHSIDLQKDALDKRVEVFEEAINDQKEQIDKEISSEEKLYQLAIERLENSDWDVLYQELIAWNTEYGNSLNKEITDAWKEATEAVEKYGSVVKALEELGKKPEEEPEEEKPKSDIVSKQYDHNDVDYWSKANEMRENSIRYLTSADPNERQRLANRNAELASEMEALGLYRDDHGAWHRKDGSLLYNDQDELEKEIMEAISAVMKQNSIAWWTASEEERARLAADNKYIAEHSNGRVSNNNGTWVDKSGNALYSISGSEKEAIAKQLVSMMKSNSSAWGSASPAEQQRLSAENVRIADSLASLLNAKVTRDDSGVWYINGEKLYDKYHSGGIVGGGSIKDNERFALLNKGEMVLSDTQKKTLEHLLAVGQMLRDKSSLLADSVFGGMVNNIASNSMKGIRNQLPGDLNKPTQIVQVDASLTVSGAVDDDVLRVIKRHPDFVAEQVAKVII